MFNSRNVVALGPGIDETEPARLHSGRQLERDWLCHSQPQGDRGAHHYRDIQHLPDTVNGLGDRNPRGMTVDLSNPFQMERPRPNPGFAARSANLTTLPTILSRKRMDKPHTLAVSTAVTLGMYGHPLSTTPCREHNNRRPANHKPHPPICINHRRKEMTMHPGTEGNTKSPSQPHATSRTQIGSGRPEAV
jgi:hypothetical protein